MAKLSLQNAFASEAADSFSGINRCDLAGKLSEAYDMTNLRILCDGSLARREGYACLAQMPAPVTAVAATPTQPELLYVITGGTLYSVSLIDGSFSTIQDVGSYNDPACFITMPDKLFLVCGEIYEITPTGIKGVSGYVPLIGRNWKSYGGEPYEPLNLMSQRAHIHYVMEDRTSILYTGQNLLSVDAVYANGARVNDAVPLDGTYVQLPYALEKQTEVDVYFTVNRSDLEGRAELMSCTQGYSCGKGDRAISVLFGGKSINRMFCIKQASAEQQAAYAAVYPEADRMYCPMGQMPLTDMPGGIRAVCGEPDCLLVVGAYDSRRIYPDGELSIPGVGGCKAQGSVAYFNGTAYIASIDGIRRLPLRSGRGELISHPLGDLISPDASADAVLYYNPAADELIVSDPEDSAGTAFIFNAARECWYKFEGIGAQGFFRHPTDTSVCFWVDDGMFRFSPELTCDRALDGNSYPIPILYRSCWSALGKSDDVKRVRRMRAVISGGGRVRAQLSDPLGVICSQELEVAEGEQLSMFDNAVRSGRAIHLRLTLSSQDTAPTRIHGFALSAIK